METIKSIKKLKGPSYSLKTESGLNIKVSEDSLVKHRLLKGEEITETLLETIRKEAELDIGYQLALSYVSFQLRSEKELKDHLRRKEISDEGIDYVIHKLQGLDLLDDRGFAMSYVRTALRTTDKGPGPVRQHLLKKGVPKEIIDEAMVLFDDVEQKETAMKLAEKGIRSYRTKSHQETVNKIRQLLFTKGFKTEVIEEVMAELPLEKDDDEEWEKLVNEGDKLWRRHRGLEGYKRRQKIQQALYRKGHKMEEIHRYLDEKEMEID